MIQEFIKYLSLNKGYSSNTCREYRKDMQELVKFLNLRTDIKRWSEVTKEHLDGWVAIMSMQGLQAPTIKRRISCVRSFYQYAWVKGLTTENPAKYVSTPKKEHKLPKLADIEKITRYLRASTTDIETKGMVAILAETGIRISELLNIRTNDIDMENRTIKIYGKGAKERRVFFGDLTYRYLQQQHTIGNAPLFNINERLARYKIYMAVGSTPHHIRHTWATEMLNNGADLKSIGTLMGHQSVKTTEIYAEVATAKLAAQYNQYSHNYGKAGERKSA